jgi:hypothetical protein
MMQSEPINPSAPRRASGSEVVTVVGWEKIPAAIRHASAMPDPSYVDLFRVSVAEQPDASAEGWARAILEDTPTGRSAPRLWRLLGLRLGPPESPDHVQGWEIVHRDRRWIRLAAASWCMNARAVVWIEDGELSLAVFVRFDRPEAAIIWPPVAVVHRRAVPVMLRQAVAPLS